LSYNPDFFLTAIIDRDEGARKEIAAECRVPVLAGHASLIGQIDAAVIAATTSEHFAIGRELLRAGVHVLMEKPLAATADEAAKLVEAAEAKNVVLQVGHVERFNPAFEAVAGRVGSPKLLRALRRSGYTGRATDIGVVLDLMIHDLDLALSLAGSPVASVAASGHAVFGPHEDVAEARITFASGATAVFYASRVSFDPCRRLEIDAESALAIVDFQSRAARLATYGPKLTTGSIDIGAITPEERSHLSTNLFQDPDLLPLDELAVADTNPISEEHDDFAASIREGRPPRVDGRQALAAMIVAEQILAQIAAGARPATVPFASPSGRRKAG
jgi:predicted dehydrogenase